MRLDVRIVRKLHVSRAFSPLIFTQFRSGTSIEATLIHSMRSEYERLFIQWRFILIWLHTSHRGKGTLAISALLRQSWEPEKRGSGYWLTWPSSIKSPVTSTLMSYSLYTCATMKADGAVVTACNHIQQDFALPCRNDALDIVSTRKYYDQPHRQNSSLRPFDATSAYASASLAASLWSGRSDQERRSRSVAFIKVGHDA